MEGNLLPYEAKNREVESKRLYDELLQKRTHNKKYNDILQKREVLPAYAMKEEVVDCIYNSRVVVISGTNLRTCIHMHIRTYMHAYAYTYICTYIFILMLSYVLIYTLILSGDTGCDKSPKFLN